MRRMNWLVVGVALLAMACSGESEDPCLAICDGNKCGATGECDCGQCGLGNICMEGTCIDEEDWNYQQTCGGGKCGEVDGCDCGACEAGEVCNAEHLCVEDPCAASCQGFECGTVDGCPCGTCGGDQTCSGEGVCEAPDQCLELCLGLECGELEGCICGTCGEGLACTDGGCECLPSCDKKKCGSNGCGGSCGDCPEGKECGLDGSCYDTICLDEMVFGEGQKLDMMAIGSGGHPGEALDVDGDPDTCAPEGDCELGLNNQLSGLLGQISDLVDANAELAKALDEGKLVLLAEVLDYEGEGIPFTLNMYLGDPSVTKEECDYQTEICDYLVDPGSFDLANCMPLITFEGALVEDGVLIAGGPEALFALAIPFTEELILTVTANMAQIRGSFVAGDPHTITDGLVGGAIRKDKLIEAVLAVPDEVFDGFPVTKTMLITILEMFVQPDVDTDEDGEADAASVGIKFSTIGAHLIGVGNTE